MNHKPSRIVIPILLVVLALTSLAAAQNDLGKVRAATARYQQPEVALAAGYQADPACVALPGVGGMGYHYLNFGLLDLELDPLQPEALVYEALPNGKHKLVATEYIVPAAPWDAAGNPEPPVLFGHSFNYNPHLDIYALHVWVWKHNPAGMFADWNPNVSCN